MNFWNKIGEQTGCNTIDIVYTGLINISVLDRDTELFLALNYGGKYSYYKEYVYSLAQDVFNDRAENQSLLDVVLSLQLIERL